MTKFYIFGKKSIFLILLAFLFVVQSINAQGTGSIKGKILDKETGEPLFAANVLLQGTTYGAASNFEGKFEIRSVPAGDYVLLIRYIGYEEQAVNVTIVAGRTLSEDYELQFKVIEGEEVVITGQAKGQLSSINQQLSSNNIVNIVSAEKMEELPDANIAESIGRLPGISLQRDAGEAFAVVVRGLSAKFNEVTIEGIPMSSTNFFDRSIDLSLLSDDLIKGVEVSKTLRADMDANALGGTVNLTLRTAEPGFKYDIKGNGAYNDLGESFNNFKFSGGLSNRYLDDKVGFIVQGNFELKQLPSDQFNAAYETPVFDSQADEFRVTTQNAQLSDGSTERNRIGVSLILDYASDFVDVKLFNVYDQKRDSNIIRTKTSRFNSNEFFDQLFVNETKIEQRTHSLQTLFKIGDTKLPISLSFTKGEQNIPNGLEFDFLQTGIPAIPTADKIYGDPRELILQMGVIDPTSVNTTLWNMLRNNTSLSDESVDIKIDWKVPIKLSESFFGNLSAGFKYHSVKRESNSEQDYLFLLFGAGAGNRQRLIGGFDFLEGLNPDLQAGIPASPFVDQNYTRTEILGNPIGPDWTVQQLVDMQNSFYETNRGDYWESGPNGFTQDYTDEESTLAGYIMGEFNIGRDLTIVPGVRFQEEETDISAFHIRINTNNQNGLDGTLPRLVNTKRLFNDWYPSINIKYKANENIQIMGAVYKSVSLPSYGEISPLVQLQDQTQLVAGNPLLEPSTSWNFDLGASLFNNEMGLFTVNVFYKEISNLIYNMQNYFPFQPHPIINAPDDIFDRLPGREYFDTTWAINQGRRLTSGPIPMNATSKAFLRGIELSWQTHLWYLPGVLSGIVLDLNLSLMSSDQEYPSFEFKPKKGFLTPDTLVYQTISGTLQDQPKAIFNAIIGWDYEGFSSRVSFRFQKETLTGIDTRFGLQDSFYDDVLLIDVSLKQKIMGGLSVYANATNINTHVDDFFFSHPRFVSSTRTYEGGRLPTSGQTYSWNTQFGFSFAY